MSCSMCSHRRRREGEAEADSGSEEEEEEEPDAEAAKEEQLKKKIAAWLRPKTPHYFYCEGQRLHVRHWLPPQAALPKASVIYIHGLNGHVNRPTLAELGQALAKAGFAMLTFDLPGNGYSEGLRSYVDDMEDLFEAIVSFVAVAVGDGGEEEADLGLAPALQQAVRARPYFLLGESMGGMLAMYASLRLKETASPWVGRFRGTILSGPALDVDTPHPAVIWLLQTVVVPLARQQLMPAGIAKSSKPDPALVLRDLSNIEMVELDDVNRFPDVALGWQSRMRWATASAFATVYSRIQEDMKEVDYPFLVMHDPEDAICKFSGTQHLMDSARSGDKTLAEKPGGLHDLVANEFEWVMGQILPWMVARC